MGNRKLALQVISGNGSLDSNLIFVLVGTWFMLSRNDTGQNNRYWCSEKPHAVHDVQLYDSKLGSGV
jgi:hypothetical protein